MSKGKRPIVFIGASVGAADVLDAVAINLNERDLKIRLNQRGTKKLGTTPLEDLVNQAKEFDAAVLIFDGEDMTYSEEKDHYVIQSNIVLQTGFLLASLGVGNVYWLVPEGKKVQIPEAITGINYGTYQADNEDLIAAVTPFCAQVAIQVKNRVDPVIETGQGSGMQLENEEEIEDLRYSFYLHVFNQQGDTSISKRTTCRPHSTGISERSHEAYSFTSIQNLEDLNLEAWDRNKQNLDIRIEENFPNRKEFIVKFGKDLALNKKYEYTYKYQWNGLYPIDEPNSFVMKPNSSLIEFYLIIPVAWSVKSNKFTLKSYSEGRTPTHGRVEKEDIAITQGPHGVYKYYHVRFDAFKPNINQIKLEWEFNP